MRCDIVIPVWNQLEFTRDCIDSLVRNTDYPYRLILVDNGSDTLTRRYLESTAKNRSSETFLIRNEENLGFIKAVNQGLKASTAPYICIMNNDTLPAPGWLKRMVEFAEGHPDIGLINPQCDGHGDMSIDAYADILKEYKGRYMEMNQCQGWCMLLKRTLMDRIGLLDESFGIGGYDDTDYSMRAHMAGYRCVAIKDSYVYHRQHASFNESGDREAWVRRNRKIYYDKWGRHLRVGLVASFNGLNADAVSRVMTFAYGLAREWAWVRIWINCNACPDRLREAAEKALSDSGLPPHQNIKPEYFRMPQAAFNFMIAGKMLERLGPSKRDKRFDAVVFMGGESAWPAAQSARLIRADVLKLKPGEGGADWQAKGRKAAASIKASKGRYGKIAV